MFQSHAFARVGTDKMSEKSIVAAAYFPIREVLVYAIVKEDVEGNSKVGWCSWRVEMNC